MTTLPDLITTAPEVSVTLPAALLERLQTEAAGLGLAPEWLVAALVAAGLAQGWLEPTPA